MIDACDVTLSVVYPHRGSLKNMPGHGGNRILIIYFPISLSTVFLQCECGHKLLVLKSNCYKFNRF